MPALINVAANGTTIPAGVLVTPDNAGHFSRDKFTFGSEVDFTMGVDITTWLRLFVGYDFLYWSSVVRPGAQVTNVVNLSQVPLSVYYNPNQGPVHPSIPFRGSDFWVQGLHVGLEVTF